MISIVEWNWAPTKDLLRASLLLLLLCDVFAEQRGEVCTNPEGLQGTCIGIRSCPSLLSAILVKPLPQATVDFLRKSQCGYQNGDPLVCCTSNNQPSNVTNTRPVGNEETEDVSQHRNKGLLRTDICGSVNDDRIQSGTRVQLMGLPWMALLAYTVQSGSPFMCGGSVINDRYVLTAAHCVAGLPSNISLVSVRLGEHDLSTPIDCEGDISDMETCAPAPQDISIERVIPHPRYVGSPNYQHDIALLRLSSPANFTGEAVKPTCLPSELDLQTENFDDQNMTVSGWGVKPSVQPSPELRRWSVPVVPYSQCSEEYKNEVPISPVRQICVQDTGNRSESCPGDSGGPLFSFGIIERLPRAIQNGIFSFGTNNCGSSSKPGVYTRVGHYMKWILDTIEP